MRYLVASFATFVFVACSTTPANRSQSQAASPGQVLASEGQKAPLDPAVQFLLDAAATDFHTHRPSHSTRFRQVRSGQLKSPDGEKKHMLCGEFLPAQEKGKAEWMPFVTIKTSGYEQWL